MALAMRAKKLTHPHQCMVDRCRGRDTILYYRGNDYGNPPMHICSDCVRDIVAKYVEVVGADTAREKLGGVLEMLKPVEETALETAEPVEMAWDAEETPAPKRSRRKAAE